MASVLSWLLGAAVVAGTGLLIIPKQLWRRWSDRTVDRLDEGLVRGLSLFDKRYRQFMVQHMRFVDLKSLATVGFYTPELDDVFVDVSLTYRSPHHVPQDILGYPLPGVGDRLMLLDLLGRPKPVVLVVMGVPGSGKSTLLRNVTGVACRSRRDRKRSIAILLQLREHAPAIVAAPDITLPALVRRTIGSLADKEPPGWFEQRLRDGDCVVQLDGLDEVGQQDDRRMVADWVDLQTKQYPDNDYVITTRRHGYRDTRIGGALVLQVRGFSDEQVTRFVRSWYLAVERNTSPATREDEDIRRQAESAAADLLDRLNGAPALYDLTVNPLLLTMIAIVHRDRGALPGSRVDLYRDICEVVLWRHRVVRNLPSSLSGDQRETLLRGVAFAMMERRVRDLPVDDVLEQIRPMLSRMAHGVNGADVLAEESRDGLFVERESGVYSFAHQTFQEYLAAEHIRDRRRELEPELCKWVDDIWWRETTLLYVARSDADAIVRACLKSDTVTALSLAFDCAAQCRELAPELRTQLERLLTAGLASDASAARRRLMVGVTLTRHLAPVVRTGRNTRVCVNPVTSHLYRLYRQDVDAAPAPTVANRTRPDDPVAGASAADAEDFIRWVNSTIGQAGYRLPTRAEVTDSGVQRALGTSTHSVWLQSDGETGRPSLWVPPGQPHPHLITPNAVAEHLLKDFQRAALTMARLLLLRSIGTSLSVKLDPDHDHGQARAIAYELGVAHHLAGPHLSQDFPAAEALARDLVHNIGRDHSLARRSASDLHATLQRMERLDRAHAHSRPLDRILALDNDDAWAWAHALTDAMRRALEPKPAPAPADWLGVVAAAFVGSARSRLAECHVAPGSLPELVRAAGERFGSLQLPSDAEYQRWSRELPDRLTLVAAIPPGQDRPAPGNATAIRLGALCLADAVSLRDGDLADLFRTIAACVTLYELRGNGQIPVTETIVLATA
ncbi:MAG TPA: NACHT domain-containing protein [Actinophytocola sp.]|uniref:NACHT domain-containing protein n=1 Tax=Actinophytocola sp. TaxID=1872138 RepID=UPI002DB825CE|nr:NACHT domain-containing protein [Actinophytocola sp.]HEU5471199.1 NACHT domain-containing protein [Actinophytocola sp.]